LIETTALPLSNATTVVTV